MIIEDYVSFETAKLLKEKGFDDKCRALYTFWFDEVEGPKEDKAENWNVEPKYFSAPTLQMAIKWIRSKGFHIYSPMEIDYEEDERGDKWYHDAAYYLEIIRVSDGKIMYDDGNLYAEPEQAAEAAIKYCLENLI